MLPHFIDAQDSSSSFANITHSIDRLQIVHAITHTSYMFLMFIRLGCLLPSFFFLRCFSVRLLLPLRCVYVSCPIAPAPCAHIISIFSINFLIRTPCLRICLPTDCGVSCACARLCEVFSACTVACRQQFPKQIPCGKHLGAIVIPQKKMCLIDKTS